MTVPVLGVLGLSSPTATNAQEATPAVDLSRLSPVVTNSFFPLASLRSTVLEGEEEDPETGETIQTRVELTVLPETSTVAGVEVTVTEVKEYEDGELVEATLDYYAQDADGTVYYLGERVDVYEEGTVIGHEGTWLAGEGANQPGVYMPAHPEAGQVFEQERAPGVAEDQSTVLAVDEAIVTPAGAFSGCLQVEDFAPIEGGTGEKYYCLGVGIAREAFEGGSLDLVTFESTTPSTPTAG
jgi:uncharacterized Fe-S cluster protein YjdI